MLFQALLAGNKILTYNNRREISIKGRPERHVRICERSDLYCIFRCHAYLDFRSVFQQFLCEETVRSLERILRKYHNIENISSTGNDVIDAIINAKYAAAREYGVSFRLHLCVPETLAVEPCDLGVVIGNALDNAIAAVRECGEEEKVITISMGVRKNAWIMVMKNSYAHEIRQNRNGQILSSKPDRERHGYGLRSIKRIAETCAGDIIIETENHCFCLTVVLNLREEKPCLT